MSRLFHIVIPVLIAAVPAAAQLPRLPQLESFDVMNPPPIRMPLRPVAHTPPDPHAVVRGLIQHIESDTALSAKTRSEALELLHLPDVANQPQAVANALTLLDTNFDKAMKELSMERVDAALQSLAKARATGNPYLAAHADFFAARAHLQREDYEAARPLLEKVVGEHLSQTLYSGEAMFMLGVCRAELIERDRAVATLNLFLEHYPQASERMAIGAAHLLDELAAMADGTIIDVSDRMDYSRRRLHLQRTARVTQREQNHIVRLLDDLIEEAEQKENSGGGGGQGSGQGSGMPQGSGQPSNPAQESTAPVGQAQIGELHRVHRGSAEEEWGQARKKEIDAVLSSPDSKIPNHYRELIEQYYRSMQKQGSTP